MTPVYVLLLTFFLHGGMVATQSIVAHSAVDCQASLPLIKQQVADVGTVSIGGKEIKIDYLDAQCVRAPAGHDI